MSETKPEQSSLGVQQTIGHRAFRDLLGSELLQPKLRIGAPNDRFEHEADRMADTVTRMPAPDAATSVTAVGRSPSAELQRMCSECAGEEEETVRRQPLENEEEDLLQPKAAPGAPSRQPGAGIESRVAAARGGGRPLAPAERSFFEPRFGHDFSDVRVHTGSAAVEASQSIGARAFTLGRNVVFGAGEYAPESPSGRHLLAHELTHVVQQTPSIARRKPWVQRQPVSTAPSTEGALEGVRGSAPEPLLPEVEANRQETAAPGLIVDDEAAQADPGQMKKSAFLNEFRSAACAAAEEVFAGTEHTAQGCLWIEAALKFYQGQSVERLERDLAAYVPEAAGVATARDYIPFMAARVRHSVEVWVKTGEVTGLPEGLSGVGLAEIFGEDLFGAARIFFKAKRGGPKGNVHPRAVQAQLGAGRPLASAVGSRMGSAFGRSFSGVRIHSDPGAARLSSRLNAKAFTVGKHVAFGSGEYRPGTLAGDALIAHELAHVAQQERSDVVHSMGRGTRDTSLEDAADLSAANAVFSLWTKSPLRIAVPRLRSGLQLQRCNESEKGSALTVVGNGASTKAVELAKERMTEVLGGLQAPSAGDLKDATIELHIIPHDKKLTDLKAFSYLKGTKTFDGRNYDDLRGVGGVKTGDTIRYAVAEEQLISVPGKPSGYARGFVAGHESGHIVEQFGLTEDQKKELQKAYDARKKAGGPWLSPEWYSKSNVGEYFAQATAAYFGRPYSDSETDKKTYTREWLKKNDRAIYDLLKSVYK